MYTSDGTRRSGGTGSNRSHNGGTETTPLLAAAGEQIPDESEASTLVEPQRDRAETGTGPETSGKSIGNGGRRYGSAGPGPASTPGGVDGADDEVDGATPADRIPKAQVFWLCVARLVEPLAYFSIFPYISEMAQRNGSLDDADVGFYAGLIESLFSITQMLMMLPIGRLSDRVGRRPVLVISLAGVAAATCIFGLARNITQMVVFRCLAGVFAGTLVTVRTMLAELSSPKTQARIFSWFAFAGNLGIFVGPLIGGALADPAEQYGGVFERVRFFVEYPYALASLVVGGVGIIATVACAFTVQETLMKREDPAVAAEGGDAARHDGNGAAPKPNGTSAAPSTVFARDPEMSIGELLRAPGVGIVLFNYAYLTMLATGYTAIVPVWWYTPVELGGFGFTSPQISMMMAVNGVAQATWLLVIFPPLQRRIGTNGVMRSCGLVYPLFFAIAPGASYLLRGGHDLAFWFVFPPALAIACGVSMSFTAIQLSVNDVSPSPRVLGTINSLSLAIGSGVRAFAPGLFGSLFALGARTQWLNGHAIWLFIFLLAVGFGVITRYLPDYDELKKRREAEAADRSEVGPSR